MVTSLERPTRAVLKAKESYLAARTPQQCSTLPHKFTCAVFVSNGDQRLGCPYGFGQVVAVLDSKFPFLAVRMRTQPGPVPGCSLNSGLAAHPQAAATSTPAPSPQQLELWVPSPANPLSATRIQPPLGF